MSGSRVRRDDKRLWLALLAVVALGVSLLSGALAAATPAEAAVPPTPVAAPFDAGLCESTTGNPAVDADGGPVTNLLSVFGGRLESYNAGGVVPLYNNSGRSGWTSTNSQYAANPICTVRYSAEANGPVSSWTYCTYDRASVCSWTNEDGYLERNGTVLPNFAYVNPDTRLTADQQKLQAYIIQNDLPVVAGPNGNGGTVAADTVANNDSPAQRTLRQNLVHCIDNPGKTSALVFCENNMNAATQARILEIIGATPAAQLGAESPAATFEPGADGTVTVTTTLAGIPLELDVTGGTLTTVDGPATLSGTTLTVNADATLPATLTLHVTRADAGTVSVAVSGVPPVIENVGYAQTSRFAGDTLCQIFATFETERQQPLIASAEVVFADEAIPTIGTSLVDSADQDQVLPWNGGTVVDTVTYDGLTPGTEYTVAGELYNQADGTATGITASTTFTPTAAAGTVDVTFTIPTGYAGTQLVAFEWLYLGTDTDGEAIAEHTDIEDAAQTVTIEEAPTTTAPSIGTSLTDDADGDRTLPWNGGTVTDTVAYAGLTPGTEYTVTGELQQKSDGSATGITGSTTFTPTESSGSVDVTFTVPAGYGGEQLVAFEWLYTGTDTEAEPIAEHTDIEDAAQTVSVEELPVTATPSIGTTLLDSADGDHVLPWNGGTVIDTVAYQGLTPGTEYTLTGELHDQATGDATRITGSTTFTPTSADGAVEVSFIVPQGYAGTNLVAFEWLYAGSPTDAEPVAEHTDIADAAQTVSVESTTTATPAIGTSLTDDADGDRVLPAAGGSVTDVVAYQNLTPGTEYTLTGELMDQATGKSTDITGSVTFTPTTANGSVEVSFTIPSGHAGSHLVAFESLFTGTDTSVEPIAVHHDIDDAAQTVTIERSTTTTPTTPTTPTTKPGTSTPSTPVKPTTGSGLANTGGESAAPIALAGGAALLLGAALIAVRRRRTRAGVRAE